MATLDGSANMLTYDAENRLQQVKQGSTVLASYTLRQAQGEPYDADGNRVKAVMGSSTTVYIGATYEKTTSGSSTTIRKYYQAGGQRVAMRVNGVVRWLATDHLGSTTVTVSESGGRLSEIRYKPWGESRYTFGATPTKRRFTGQVLDEVAGGLYFYNARYYDPTLGRFVSADTIVSEPGNPQGLNRYSYAENNPLRFSDPSGRFSEDEIMKYLGVKTWKEVMTFFEKGGKFEGRWGWLGVLRQAELGDTVRVLEGWNGGWFSGTVDDITAFEGSFVEHNGQLFVQGDADNVVAADMVGLWGDAYYTAKRDSYGVDFGGRQIDAQIKCWTLRPRPLAGVDWVGVGFDVTGIAADILTLGAGGRVVNGVQVARAANKIGSALDVASFTYAGLQMGAAATHGDWGSAGSGAVDMTLAGLGTGVPIVFDLASLVKAFVQLSP